MILGGVGNIYQRHKEIGNRKFLYLYQVSGHVLLNFLPKLVLTGKDEQRKLVIEACHLISEHRTRHTPHMTRLGEICLEFRRLNKKGRF